MKNEYSICGVQFRFDTKIPITGSIESDMFLSKSDTYDIHVVLQPVKEIVPPDKEYASGHPEHLVTRTENIISRYSWDSFRKYPHMLMNYRLDNPYSVQCYVREEDWAWATSGKYLWTGIGIQALLLHQKAFILHASVVEYKGHGIVFTAPSGIGKSTQASLWKKYRGAEIMNGDKVGISLRNGIMVHGLPFSGTSGISMSRTVPLEAIVCLAQSQHNLIRRLSARQAIQFLYTNCFVERSVPEESQTALNLLLELIQDIPIYHLECTPDERAVIELEKVLDDRKGDSL